LLHAIDNWPQKRLTNVSHLHCYLVFPPFIIRLLFGDILVRNGIIQTDQLSRALGDRHASFAESQSIIEVLQAEARELRALLGARPPSSSTPVGSTSLSSIVKEDNLRDRQQRHEIKEREWQQKMERDQMEWRKQRAHERDDEAKRTADEVATRKRHITQLSHVVCTKYIIITNTRT
jgi:hypothetical protein